MHNFIISLAGTIPAPILFGTLIDKTCQLWQSTCQSPDSSQGSCYFYDNGAMSLYIMLLAVVGKTLSVIFFVLALILYRPPPPPPTQQTEANSAVRSSGEPRRSDGEDYRQNVNDTNSKKISYVADERIDGCFKTVDDRTDVYFKPVDDEHI